MNNELIWSREAEERLNRAPSFLRPMVKNVTEKRAREAGVLLINEEFLSGVRDTTMTAGDEPKSTVPEPGRKAIVWTKEARARLDEIPEFTRDITRKIIEEIAAERGHLEVNCKLFDQIEELGSASSEADGTAMEWADDAEVLMDERLSTTPELAVTFMRDLLRADAEDIAREMGVEVITAEVLKRTWTRPQTPVPWNKEARARLNDAPDFVRSGIKKAAERRARREGLAEITSDDLTRFRNESMMKAVKRMRVFGFKELTFDGVFETASSRVKRLKNNPQAAKRFAEIRQHVEDKEGGVGLLDHEMVQKMKDYLKE